MLLVSYPVAGVPQIPNLLPSNPWVHLTFYLLAGLAALYGSGIGYARTHAAEVRADQATATIRVTMSDALTPLMTAVNRSIAATTKEARRTALGTGLQAILSTAKDIIGPPAGVRACWYELVVEEREDKTKVEVLRPGQPSHFGRSEHPRAVFRQGTVTGDRALRMVHDDSHDLVKDVSKLPADLLAERQNSFTYRTYCTASVSAQGSAFGMLTVDAPNVGDLTEEDEATLWFLATMLAGMHLRARQ